MRPFYKKKKIGSVASLGAALRVSDVVLKHTAATLEQHYTPYEIPKKSGKPRSILIPSLHLKTLQKRINREIFAHVQYPDYLFGGVEGKDYVRNARVHAGSHVLISLDVKDFYPSITFDRVKRIYQHFLQFDPAVSELLAKLTTYNNSVPQGACTSSHLANLILHDVEYHLAQYCATAKLTYTRLLDDICISSKTALSKEKIAKLIDKVSSMLRDKGMKLKHQKTRVCSKSNPKELMEVTGLWINRGAPRVKPTERRKIRVDVHRCQVLANQSLTNREYDRAHASVSGRVAMLSYLGHSEAERLRKSVAAILPQFDIHEISKTKKIVALLSRASAKDRNKYSFILNFNKTMQRLNIVARTDPKLAVQLRKSMATCRPTKRADATLYDEPI
ncbi:reverse transcriptase (RNA-dependent DNA polymerase) [Paraburkholderia sp. GV068]|nr:reverse transcriptase (RNA-dependent DNA polymerase) [Paraburkholderia sp. GV072]PUB08039.1 reverse transcriptase (RNA-dependent DNA polymerase) [Paraburkholderia sp. GV068]